MRITHHHAIFGVDSDYRITANYIWLNFFFIGTIATNEKNFEKLAKSITNSNEYNLLSI